MTTYCPICCKLTGITVGNPLNMPNIKDDEWCHCGGVQSLRDRIAKLESEAKYQLQALRNVDEALGTSEGDSAVPHIVALRDRIAELEKENISMLAVCSATIVWHDSCELGFAADVRPDIAHRGVMRALNVWRPGSAK